MKYRILQVGEIFRLEATFERGWLMRLFLGEDEWHWIHSYRSLKEAKRGRDFLMGEKAEGAKVVG